MPIVDELVLGVDPMKPWDVQCPKCLFAELDIERVKIRTICLKGGHVLEDEHMIGPWKHVCRTCGHEWIRKDESTSTYDYDEEE